MGADARMPGDVAQSWCWVCHAPPGIDCPDRGLAPRDVRVREKRETRRLAETAILERHDGKS